jgi:hypothetical protein
MTALMDAVRRNDVDKVRQLIAQGVDVDQTDSIRPTRRATHR